MLMIYFCILFLVMSFFMGKPFLGQRFKTAPAYGRAGGVVLASEHNHVLGSF